MKESSDPTRRPESAPVVAIVAARGQSKGIPRKNLQDLGGRPLIVHSLEAARAAKCIDDILVTTDDDEIAGVCESFGIRVPYRRRAALATDSASMLDVVLDALDHLEQTGRRCAIFVLLQPTSPLRSSRHIDESVQLFRQSGAGLLTSVHEVREHPYDCVSVSGQLSQRGRSDWTFMMRADVPRIRRQDYHAKFHYVNGALYVGTPQALRRNRAFLVEGETVLYPMDPLDGIDIDTMEDLELARALVDYRGHKSDARRDDAVRARVLESGALPKMSEM